ncbi:MAG TPA: serine hydrolase domain-containing protein [Pseudonocardiaceae bacterium]|nr:serine hydrolase domain-containing protein [Pseudonocardiaceae bacterium]
MRIQDRVAELLAEYGVPSAAIGVLHNGQISEFAVGVKNVLTREPATTDTVYQCGSMTKTWTAAAFLQLVDEGKVDLDEPVRDYLPGFKIATVTARHLLNHTNGIEELYGDVGEGEDVYERMVENSADAPQVFPVGRTHGYSAALGYAILARILEVRDGKRWDAIMRDRLFRPMGLRSTHTWHEDVEAERAATGHLIRSLDEGPFVTPMDRLPREYGPGGNLTSTTGEVLTLAQMLLNGGVVPNGNRILSADAVHEMMYSRVPVPDPYLFGPEWALGLIVCDWSGHTVYASDGSTIGQNSRLRLLPDSNTAIVMLTNGSPRDSFYRTVFNEILTELGTVTIPELPTPNPDLRLDPARYVGVYERPGTRFEVHAEAGKLYLTHVLDPLHAEVLGKPERIRYELLPVDETHFLMPPSDPLEDTQSAAIYDRYLHTNARVHVRLDS